MLTGNFLIRLLINYPSPPALHAVSLCFVGVGTLLE
jgi:hypothetical protein